ncbi:MAG: DNA polymerase III subunit alpha, partial [Spirochaetales bacterium]|nr:DNA polymerase III subunit alpha [Spirochaetales bacterium]
RSREHAIEIFEMLEPFANYGFNKSHALAYSVIAYQTAYLKANHPAEFWAANLTNEMSNPDKFSEYLQTVRAAEIEILPPSVNYSLRAFAVVDGRIVYGLAGIKHVGEGVVDAIVAERDANGPYTDLIDFLTRLDSKVANSKVMESLIKAGAFDELGTNRPTLLENLSDAVASVQRKKELTAYGQISLFDEESEEMMDSFRMKEVEDWSVQEKLENEKALLGFYVSGHPLDRYRNAIRTRVTVDTSRMDRIPLGQQTNIIALLTQLKPYTTRRGDTIAFVQLTDLNTSFEGVIFADEYERVRHLLEVDRIYGFEGTFDKRGNGDERISFRIDSVKTDPDELAPRAVNRCHVLLEKSFCTTEQISRLRDTTLDFGGSCALHLHFREQGKNLSSLVECGREFAVRCTADLATALKKNSAVLDVWFD